LDAYRHFSELRLQTLNADGGEDLCQNQAVLITVLS